MSDTTRREDLLERISRRKATLAGFDRAPDQASVRHQIEDLRRLLAEDEAQLATLDADLISAPTPVITGPDAAPADDTPNDVQEPASKRARVLERLAQPDARGLSDRAIARELGVSQPLVSGCRRELRDREAAQADQEGREPHFDAIARRAECLAERDTLQRRLGEMETDKRVIARRLNTGTPSDADIQALLEEERSSRARLDILELQIQELGPACEAQQQAAEIGRLQRVRDEFAESVTTAQRIARDEYEGLVPAVAGGVREAYTTLDAGWLLRAVDGETAKTLENMVRRVHDLPRFAARRLRAWELLHEPGESLSSSDPAVTMKLDEWIGRVGDHILGLLQRAIDTKQAALDGSVASGALKPARRRPSSHFGPTPFDEGRIGGKRQQDLAIRVTPSAPATSEYDPLTRDEDEA